MKNLLYIALFFILTSCLSKQEEKPSDNKDSLHAIVIKQLFSFKHELDSLYDNDSVNRIEIEKNKMVIDTLITKSINYKSNEVELTYIKSKFDQLKKDKEKITRRTDSLRRAIASLSDQKYILESDLKKTKGELSDFKSSYESTKSKASKLKYIGLNAIAIGYKKGLFSERIEYQTNKASKVSVIRVLFVAPFNEFAIKEQKRINIRFYNAEGTNYFSKDTSFMYDGNEKYMQVNFYDKNIEEGVHRVDLIVNSRIESQTHLKLE